MKMRIMTIARLMVTLMTIIIVPVKRKKTMLAIITRTIKYIDTGKICKSDIGYEGNT